MLGGDHTYSFTYLGHTGLGHEEGAVGKEKGRRSRSWSGHWNSHWPLRGTPLRDLSGLRGSDLRDASRANGVFIAEERLRLRGLLQAYAEALTLSGTLAPSSTTLLTVVRRPGEGTGRGARGGDPAAPPRRGECGEPNRGTGRHALDPGVVSQAASRQHCPRVVPPRRHTLSTRTVRPTGTCRAPATIAAWSL